MPGARSTRPQNPSPRRAAYRMSAVPAASPGTAGTPQADRVSAGMRPRPNGAAFLEGSRVSGLRRAGPRDEERRASVRAAVCRAIPIFCAFAFRVPKKGPAGRKRAPRGCPFGGACRASETFPQKRIPYRTGARGAFAATGGRLRRARRRPRTRRRVRSRRLRAPRRAGRLRCRNGYSRARAGGVRRRRFRGTGSGRRRNRP